MTIVYRGYESFHLGDLVNHNGVLCRIVQIDSEYPYGDPPQHRITLRPLDRWEAEAIDAQTPVRELPDIPRGSAAEE